MKPRSSKSTIPESHSRTSALKLENDYLKTKLAEYLKTIDNLNNHLEGLRTNNTEFAKNAEVNNTMIKNLTARVTELSKDCLIAKTISAKLERKLRDVYNVSLDVRKTFIDGTNNVLEMCKIIEADTDGDLTLGRESSATTANTSASTTSKNNMKVLPMMSGHTIQKPTISISKSDSQQINFLIQHQNEIRNDSSQQELNTSSNNSLSNNSKENTLQNVTNISNNDNIVQNSPNGQTQSNGDENLSSEEIENGDETEDPQHGRLSTIFEITNSTSITNRINVISNIVLPGADSNANSSINSANSSTNSANNSNSINRNKKRVSKMPSPIDISTKIPRRSCNISNLSKSGHFSYHSSLQKSISSIGMSTRGSSATLQSDTVSEDPMEGPSTLLDATNNSSILDSKKSEEGLREPFSSSTPMERNREKRIRKKSSNIVEPFVNYVTVRKTKSDSKKSVNANNVIANRVERINISKSLNDLSDSAMTDIIMSKSPTNRRTSCRRQQSISLAALSTNNKESYSRKSVIAIAIESSYQEINMSKSLNDLSDCRIAENIMPKQRKRCRKLHSVSITELPTPKNDSQEIPIEEEFVNPIEESSPVKKLPKKRGRPRKVIDIVKINEKRSTSRSNRKSRSYSPNYRFKNDEETPEIDLRLINPTVQLVRLAEETSMVRNKRRSRSFSPARSVAGSDRSDETEMSTRSSRRVKSVIKYNEPSLRMKMRRK